jgi:hypothetical protein
LEGNFHEEYQFLKGIDRAFWMKNFHFHQEIEDCQEKEKLKEALKNQTDVHF